jgi:L-seryl-tRNA(Ser) seleniumtransferase
MAKNKTAAGSTQNLSQHLLQSIPKVDEFLGWVGELPDTPDILIKAAVREVLAEQREAILSGKEISEKDLVKEVLLPKFRNRLDQKLTPHFRTVINATGVVVHTNLGRSLLPKSAMEPLLQGGLRYSNLEFDLATGKRGSRYSLVEDLLCELTGAEAALVVNNNAAAVMLVLDTLANGREVIVSRGQLVEIGGSFRIPDVMAKSGAILVEVGATNRTHLRDYENAITEETALLLKVHTSNFKIIGFTSEVELPELVALGNRHDLPVVEDLGSGSFVDFSRFGLQKEPTVGEVLKAGVDVVTFSGDKLLGGPQAGLILGKKEIVERIKKNPMNRALRIDKFTLASLEAVLRIYFDEEKALKEIPTLAMLALPLDTIVKRARRLQRRIKKLLVKKCETALISTNSKVGGGALPEQDLPTKGVSLMPKDRSLNQLENDFRKLPLPIIGRIENESYVLDMRTVADDEIVPLASGILEVFGIEKR